MKDVIKFLEEDGFTKSTHTISRLYDCVYAYYRKTKHTTTKECVCNDKVPQIMVIYYVNELNGRTYTSFKVELVQENDIGWVNFNYYGMGEDDIINNLDTIEKSLISAWETSFKEI